MILLYTDNANNLDLINKECKFEYKGDCLTIEFKKVRIKTHTVLEIKKEQELIKVYTLYYMYTFKDE